jgi:2',3'-cyclic-nucleotide 2'-phosphodiesterase (5'-nucleotidase family)
MLALLGSVALAETKHAKLIFSSDLPVINDKINGDYAQLATIVKLASQKNNTFFLFGGGSLGPSPMSAFDRGSHIIDILNSIEPDAMGVTKREFSYFEDELSLRSFEAAFPIVASNLLDPLTQANIDGLVDRVIIEKNGLKLGIVSLINQTVITEYLLERIQVRDPLIALETTASNLRLQGVDFIVLLYSNTFPFVVDALESGTIDLALLSEPHFELSQSSQNLKHPNSVYLTQLGQYADVDLYWDDIKKDSLQVKWQAKKLIDIEPDANIAEQINGYSNRLDRLLSEEIGTLLTSIDTNRPAVRGAESAFANMLADSLREFGGTDIAIVNGGVIRGEKVYPSNTRLTRKDIAKELPFRSRVELIKVTGAKLYLALENGVSQVEQLKGQFPQVSGMQITFDANMKAGKRVLSVKINGQPIDRTALYSLATTDYLSNGGDGYDSFTNSPRIKTKAKIAPLISDILINYIRRKQTVSPQTEDRIIEVGVR